VKYHPRLSVLGTHGAAACHRNLTEMRCRLSEKIGNTNVDVVYAWHPAQYRRLFSYDAHLTLGGASTTPLHGLG
jgi:hypothetical protein